MKPEVLKALRFSKKIVIFMFAQVIIFTVVMILIYLDRGAIPDTLVTEFFGFFRMEGGALGIIKVAETSIDIAKGKKKKETYNPYHMEDNEQ